MCVCVDVASSDSPFENSGNFFDFSTQDAPAVVRSAASFSCVIIGIRSVVGVDMVMDADVDVMCCVVLIECCSCCALLLPTATTAATTTATKTSITAQRH